MAINASDQIRDILYNAKVIAVVGHSDNPLRTSYQIAQQLRRWSYTVYAVNPMVDEIDGEKSYASLRDIPEPIDIVNVFRRPEHLPGIVDEAIEIGAKVVWGQLGVEHDGARRTAEDAGLQVVMNRCIKVEYNLIRRTFIH